MLCTPERTCHRGFATGSHSGTKILANRERDSVGEGTIRGVEKQTIRFRARAQSGFSRNTLTADERAREAAKSAAQGCMECTQLSVEETERDCRTLSRRASATPRWRQRRQACPDGSASGRRGPHGQCQLGSHLNFGDTHAEAEIAHDAANPHEENTTDGENTCFAKIGWESRSIDHEQSANQALYRGIDTRRARFRLPPLQCQTLRSRCKMYFGAHADRKGPWPRRTFVSKDHQRLLRLRCCVALWNTSGPTCWAM